MKQTSAVSLAYESVSVKCDQLVDRWRGLILNTNFNAQGTNQQDQLIPTQLDPNQANFQR